jgi:hypothetical protein
MREIESKISQLIKRQFPSFYMEEGADFVTFVEAYYEWLESNHQKLELTNAANFFVGDTVTQGETSGTIIDVDGKVIIVRVNNFDAFRCNILCNEYLPIDSSSGGSSIVEKQFKLNPIHWSRKLFSMRDVDKTLDQFIIHFKEKYLKNIEFDTNTNKTLLVKNSFDLYRSKGTERSIDLFFRLVYGEEAQVYYPGEDVMRLSAAEWVKPKYLEITNSPKTINLVGKQIVGAVSGATAFVEKYIKRRIKGGFVYVIYVSNESGTFVNNEFLKIANTPTEYDLPKVVGSLSSVTVTAGSRLFSVGDVVSFTSTNGDEGLARVASVSNATGVVDFIFIDGGYGYTVSGNTSLSTNELLGRSQSIVSENVLTLTNVRASNTLAGFIVNNGGTGYTNGDVVTAQSEYTNAAGKVITNGSGVITQVDITEPGGGFFTNFPTVTIATSGGTSANITADTKPQTRYFNYFEPFRQVKATIVYDTASNNQLFANGATVYIGNSSTNVAFGTIISNANGALGDANGTLIISVSNNGSFSAGNTVFQNTTVSANIVSITNTSATSTVMGVPDRAALTLTGVSNTAAFAKGAEVFQLAASGEEWANGIIEDTALSGTGGVIDITSMKGVFRTDHSTIRVRSSAATATLTNVGVTVGLYEVSNTYVNTFNIQVFSSNTGTIANVVSVAGGDNASFKVGTLSDTEIIYLNTDRLNGNGTFTNSTSQSYLTMPLDNAQYGFPKNPTGNSGSVMFDCLNFDSFTIGTIASINQINPGTGYTADPYVLVHQPYIEGFNRRDYIFAIANTTGSFVPGERILQSDILLSRTTLVLDGNLQINSTATVINVGEKLDQGGGANGIVFSVDVTANSVTLESVSGTFNVNATPVTSFSNTLFSNTILSVSTNNAITSTAKGIVKTANATHITVKRIQFENQFGIANTITGQSSGATAEIESIAEQDVLQIGFNADIDANVVTANGTVTTLEIIDSGIGYRNNQEMLFNSEDLSRAGSVIANVSGIGVGSGYYRTSRGFLSSVSKIHDGDFYQEYSYEILSRLPLDRYAETFKKVMHTAGTRFFGGVAITSTANVSSAYADSSINIS